jgi:SAM-dependent methyltransferase
VSELSERIRESYEALPYEGGPHYGGHVDCLATVAHLTGFDPVDVGRARVLEMGCATGGNLLPMALSLPDAQFVGVDLSPGQIDAARRRAKAAGLDNVRLVVADLMDVTAELGTFDYIVCHGLYSWVPVEVRRRILDLCRELLAPRGVAMVSFNAYPGSQTRDSVRALLRFALDKVLADDSDPVEATRSLMRIIPRGFEGAGGAFVAQFRRVASVVHDEPGYYLGHEFLEEVNQPYFLWEFADAAEAAGLRYLGDAWTHPDEEKIPPGARELVDKLSPTRVAREQWLDLLEDRTFRRALLVRAGTEFADALQPGRVMDLRASAGAWSVDPESQARRGEGPGASSFESGERRVSTNIPVLQAAFGILQETWPDSMPVGELWEKSRERATGAGAPADAPDDADSFSRMLLRCYTRHVLGLHVWRFPVSTLPGERPVASPLARLQAEDASRVTNLVHQEIELSPPVRRLLLLLDGSRDRAALARDLADDPAAAEPDREDAKPAERLERGLRWLALNGLLREGPEEPAAAS